MLNNDTDKGRRSLGFSMGKHDFLRVTPFPDVGRTIISKRLTTKFMGPCKLLRGIDLAYEIFLPFSFNQHSQYFYVS